MNDDRGEPLAKVVPCPHGAKGSESGGSSPSRRPAAYELTCVAEVSRGRVQWIWPGRLAVGKVAVLDGDPGVGKSTLLIDIAARLTRGAPMPGETRAHVGRSAVVFLAAEDDLADTSRPRLEAAGADLDHVHYLTSVPIYDDDGRRVGARPPTIPNDLGAIEAAVTGKNAGLLVVDPLSAYWSPGINSHKDQDVRRALAPLVEFAARTGVCVVLVRHIPKSQRGAGQAIAAGSGSIAITALARTALLAAVDPHDETGQRRVLALTKTNVGKRPPSMGYHLVADPRRGCGSIEWSGTTAHTANELLSQVDVDERSTGDELAEWVCLVLAQANGEMSNRDLEPLANAQGWSRGQLHRIKRRLVSDGTVEVEANRSAQGCPVTWRLTPQGFARLDVAGATETPARETLHGSDQGEQVDEPDESAARDLGALSGIEPIPVGAIGR